MHGAMGPTRRIHLSVFEVEKQNNMVSSSHVLTPPKSLAVSETPNLKVSSTMETKPLNSTSTKLFGRDPLVFCPHV